MKRRMMLKLPMHGYYRKQCSAAGRFLRGAAAHQEGDHLLMMSPSPPSRALKRARFDNLALVPAALLPFKATWQQIADDLPMGSILIILPASASSHRDALERIKTSFEGTGRMVKTLPASEITTARQLRLLVS